MTTHKTLPRHSLILLLTLGTLAFTAAPALAVKEYVPGISFGEPCGAGETPCGLGKLKEPSGIAVNDTTEDVYVADKGDNRVQEFSPTGTPLAQFNGSAAPTGVFSAPEYVAVDNSTSPLDSAKENVYVADNGHRVVDEFTAAGTYVGQLTGTCPAEGESQAAGKCVPSGVAVTPFGELDGIAVGAEGEVWVHDNTGNFDEFSNTGVYTTTANLSASEQPGGLALDPEGNIYATAFEARRAFKRSPSGEDTLFVKEGGVTGLAVESLTGDVLVDKASGLELYSPIAEFYPTPIQRFATGGLAESHGVAVNSTSTTQTVYATERSADDVRAFNYVPFPTVTAPAASEVSNTVETLSGTVEPEGEAIKACTFEYGLIEAEPGHYEHSVPCEQKPEDIAGTIVPVSAKIEGLTPGATYHFRLDVSNANGTGSSEDATFTTFPTAGGESFSNVGSSSATLHAQLNPGGLPTTYFFEYGPTAAYGSTTPVQSAGAGTGVVGVLATVEGLLADTTYHFRVVASSSTNGTTPGGDGTFSTFPAGQSGLPDGRGYELVSSLSNGDATVAPEGGGRAAGDGSSVAYSGQAPLAGGNGSSEFHDNGAGGVAGGFNQYLAQRGGGGWSSADIQPDGSKSPQFKGFTGDLSLGLLTSEVPLVEGAPSGQASLYSRETATGGYQLLGTNATYVDSTPDGSEMLLSHGGNLYLRASSGTESPVNVLPGGAGLAQNATFGGPNGPDLSNAISTDGSRVFWSEEEPAGKTPLRLFVSENVGQPDQRTVQVDADQGGADTAGGGGLFWTASSDGSRVFFTDCNPLTKGSTAVESTNCEHEVHEGPDSEQVPYGSDLYEYDTETGVLTDLTLDAGSPSEPEPANVVGVLGTSEDGSYVYFAAGGSLADSGATPQKCSRPIAEQFIGDLNEEIKCNVYVEHEGETRFVAAVTNYDGEAGSQNALKDGGDWTRVVGVHSAFVSPDGRSLVFKSVEDLTGFNGLGDQEIYMYDYSGGLTCVSCNPSGAPTVHGEPYLFDQELPVSRSATVALRDLSSVDGDRVFFTTTEGLVPGDRNGQRDVYEWERPGEGTCTAQTATALDNGCLYDLSGGTSTDGSDFLDASETGDDAFIETRAQLVPRDHTELFEVFDARVGATEPPAEPECTGTGCQGVPGAPPIFATPSSATFNGIGNFPAPKPAVVKKKTAAQLKAEKLSKALKACRAKRGKKRSGCEASARKKFGAAKPAKAKKKAARR